MWFPLVTIEQCLVGTLGASITVIGSTSITLNRLITDFIIDRIPPVKSPLNLTDVPMIVILVLTYSTFTSISIAWFCSWSVVDYNGVSRTRHYLFNALLK